MTFRESLLNSRAALTADSPETVRKELIESALACLQAVERTVGDRYACATALVDPAVGLASLDEATQRRVALTLFLALESAAARGAESGETRLLGMAVSGAVARGELVRWLDAGVRQRLSEILTAAADEDELLRAQAAARARAKVALETYGGGP